jgi:hypothetical protein
MDDDSVTGDGCESLSYFVELGEMWDDIGDPRFSVGHVILWI